MAEARGLRPDVEQETIEILENEFGWDIEIM